MKVQSQRNSDSFCGRRFENYVECRTILRRVGLSRDSHGHLTLAGVPNHCSEQKCTPRILHPKCSLLGGGQSPLETTGLERRKTVAFKTFHTHALIQQHDSRLGTSWSGTKQTDNCHLFLQVSSANLEVHLDTSNVSWALCLLVALKDSLSKQEV